MDLDLPLIILTYFIVKCKNTVGSGLISLNLPICSKMDIKLKNQHFILTMHATSKSTHSTFNQTIQRFSIMYNCLVDKKTNRQIFVPINRSCTMDCFENELKLIVKIYRIEFPARNSPIELCQTQPIPISNHSTIREVPCTSRIKSRLNQIICRVDTSDSNGRIPRDIDSNATTTTENPKDDVTTTLTIITIVGVVIGILMIVIFSVLIFKRCRRRNQFDRLRQSTDGMRHNRRVGPECAVDRIETESKQKVVQLELTEKVAGSTTTQEVMKTLELESLLKVTTTQTTSTPPTMKQSQIDENENPESEKAQTTQSSDGAERCSVNISSLFTTTTELKSKTVKTNQIPIETEPTRPVSEQSPTPVNNNSCKTVAIIQNTV